MQEPMLESPEITKILKRLLERKYVRITKENLNTYWELCRCSSSSHHKTSSLCLVPIFILTDLK